MNFILSNLGQYVRNLSIFILLMTFVGIVAPNTKYKNYINLVMGFVLMFLMVNPIVNLAHAWDHILVDLDSTAFVSPDIHLATAQHLQTTALFQHTIGIVEEHIQQVTIDHGFEPISVAVDALMENSEDFVIRRITIHVSDLDFIPDDTVETIWEIAPVIISEVIIGTGFHFETTENLLEAIVEDSRIINLQSYLAQFYHMSQSHIHVIVN